MIATFLANAFALVGLLFLGWSVWTVVAIYWIENLVHLPILGHRIARAFPHLSPAEREAYLAARDSERTNGVSEGLRLREALRELGPERTGVLAGRRFLVFYGAFALGHGLFVFLLGVFTASEADGAGDAVDLSVFDPVAILGAGLVLLVAEFAALRMDPRPVMPDTGAYTRRMVVLHLTIVFGAFALAATGAAGLAVLFVALKTIADLGVGRVVAGARAVARR